MGYISRIGFENFRIFDKMQKFEFAPITILTGPNNSGKSTLTKGLKLLAANAKENQLHALNLSFEGFENWDSIKNWDSKSEKTTFFVKTIKLFGEKLDLYAEYNLMKQTKIYVKSGEEKILESEKFYDESDIEYFIGYKTKIDVEWLKNFCERTIDAFYKVEKKRQQDNNELDLVRKEVEKEKLEQFSINLDGLPDEMFLSEEYIPERPNSMKDFILDTSLIRIKSVFDTFRKLTTDDLSKNLFESEFSSIIKQPLNELIHEYHYNYNDGSGLDPDDFPKIQTDVKSYSINCLKVEKIQEVIKAGNYQDFGGKFGVISEKYGCVLEFFLNEIVKQYHSASNSMGNIYFETISENLNKRIIEKSTIFNHSWVLEGLAKTHKNDREYNFIVKQIKNLGIADDIKIVKYDNFAYAINLIINNREINISELGYGFSKIVRMLINLFSLASNSVRFEFGNYVNEPFLMIIEEPEENLHPNLQSKLADLFVDIVSSYPVQLVVETHSEYLIRKLQYLIAKKTLKADSVIIHYFNSDQDKNSTGEVCKEIRINEEGVLTDSFGSGFFDEATRLKFDLLKLHKIQGN